MTFILTIKRLYGFEQKIDLETSDKEEAISNANQYTRGPGGIIEYAYLTDSITTLELSSSTGYFQDLGDM